MMISSEEIFNEIKRVVSESNDPEFGLEVEYVLSKALIDIMYFLERQKIRDKEKRECENLAI